MFFVAVRRGMRHPQKIFNLVTLHQINMVPCQNTFPQVPFNWPKYRAQKPDANAMTVPQLLVTDNSIMDRHQTITET